MGEGDRAYAQPTPRRLYIHDDLTDEVAREAGSASPAAAAAGDLIALLARDADHVRVLTLGEQVEAVAAQGPHPPFEVAIGIGAAGERVARTLHERVGWFPSIRRVGLSREEDGAGGYRLVSAEAGPLTRHLADLESRRSLALVDDTVFSGLTMAGLIAALPATVRAHTHAFCLRGVAQSIAAVAAVCPITAGVAAPGRLLHDVSFINASGLVRRIAIRRPGQPSLAFFDRPQWIRAWFPSCHEQVLARCRELNALLEGGGPSPQTARPDAGRGLSAGRVARASGRGVRTRRGGPGP
jgi:hypothetical protein